MSLATSELTGSFMGPDEARVAVKENTTPLLGGLENVIVKAGSEVTERDGTVIIGGSIDPDVYSRIRYRSIAKTHKLPLSKTERIKPVQKPVPVFTFKHSL